MYAPSKLPAGEGQGERAALHELHVAAEPRPLRQGAGDADIFIGQVDAGHPAFAMVREVARRPTDAAADVEQLQARPQSELIGELHRRLPPADMELVNRRQIVGIDALRILAGETQSVEDRRPRATHGCNAERLSARPS